MSKLALTVGREIPGRLPFEFPYPVTSLCVVSALLLSGLGGVAEWVTWQRADPLGLQLWTSHFSHWSAGHFFWDALMFAALAGIIEQRDPRLLIKLLLSAPPVILLAVWLLGDHTAYRGLSGLDSALYGSVILLLLQQQRINTYAGFCAIGFFLAKCLFELVTSDTLFVSDMPGGISPVPLAHLAGLITGLLITFSKSKSCADKTYANSRTTKIQ